MKHYGDITRINGADVPVVDIITGGSPCQDLSVAGKRAGLAGERSGLFMEQIRIVKEMREHDRATGRTNEHIRPRFMVWENVPGALSSNGGEDFRAVLEEVAKIIDEGAVIPRPENGKWANAGCILLDRGSISWRIHDAQFWGVPQRRKRIALVADFGGSSAPEILFEREGLPGNHSESGEARKAIARVIGAGVAQTNRVYGISSFDSNAMKSPNPKSGIYEADTARTLDLNGGSPACNQGGMVVVQGVDAYNQCTSGDVTMSITGAVTDPHHIPCVLNGWDVQSKHIQPEDGIAEPLYAGECRGGGGESYVLQTYKNSVGALCMDDYKGPNRQYVEQDKLMLTQNAVRRLTPLECERLQGFPDGWTDIGEWTDSKGKKHKDSDSPRYKALGNSIALPFWEWMAERMINVLKDDGVEHPTMASLFDGIGGFPLVYSRHGCVPVWASEIEEFPIAVTRIRFPEKREDKGSDET